LKEGGATQEETRHRGEGLNLQGERASAGGARLRTTTEEKYDGQPQGGEVTADREGRDEKGVWNPMLIELKESQWP